MNRIEKRMEELQQKNEKAFKGRASPISWIDTCSGVSAC